MTPKSRLLASLAVCVACSGEAACQAGSKPATISSADALGLVRQFVALDSAGKGYLAEADRLFEPCDARVGDQVEPITKILLRQSYRVGDTIAIPAEYHVVGYATSRDEREVGPRNWTFEYRPQVQVDTFRVVRDSRGDARIACGPHYGNHPALATMEWMTSKLDSMSISQWRRAHMSGRPSGRVC